MQEVSRYMHMLSLGMIVEERAKNIRDRSRARPESGWYAPARGVLGRLIGGLRSRMARNELGDFPVTEGASDVELWLLKSRGRHQEIDDVRWEMIGSVYGGVRRGS